MKKIPLLFFILYSYLLTAQQAVISGKIIDATTKKALPYVNVICKDSAQKIITGGISTAKGNFLIDKLPLQNITVEFQFIGFKTISKVITLSETHQTHNFETLLLEANSTELNEVEVQAETSTIVQKIDRRVINVGKDLVSTGTNAIALLQNIPSVNVNLQSGAISLRGNENVRVLIDGKPSNLPASQLLKQIPSSSIKKIELITNPSAKYNPEGMSGIINIILKKNTKIGFNGSLSFGITHGVHTRPTASVNLNYKTGKVNFYANYNVDWGDYGTQSQLKRTDKDFLQNFDFIDSSKGQLAKVGADIYIDKKNTLSFYITQNFTKTDFTTTTKTYENKNLILNSPNRSAFDITESTYNADYTLNIDEKGQNLELELTYTNSKIPENDFNKELINPDSKLYNYTNTITNNSKIWLANLDYTKPFSESTKLEFGLEARVLNTFHEIITDQEVETTNTPAIQPQGNTTFTYDRNIYSAYANYSKEFGKYAFQAGLRLEQFNVEGVFNNTQQPENQLYSDAIFSLYPSAYLTYFASEENEFQLSYSRRVDRPSIEQVSPIQEWTSPYSISIGNQNLTTQFTNSFELNYTRNLKTGYLFIGSFYRRISDQIGRSINQDPANADRQLISYTNYNTSNSYGFEVYASYKPTKWWTISPSMDVYVQDKNGLLNSQNVSVKNTVFNSRLGNNFKVSKRLSLQLSSVYRGKNKNIQFTVDPYYSISGGAKLSVFDGKGALSFRATDIFDTIKLDFSSTQPFPQQGFYTLEISTVYFGFSYNFGSGKNKAKSRKYREENETQSSGGVL